MSPLHLHCVLQSTPPHTTPQPSQPAAPHLHLHRKKQQPPRRGKMPSVADAVSSDQPECLAERALQTLASLSCSPSTAGPPTRAARARGRSTVRRGSLPRKPSRSHSTNSCKMDVRLLRACSKCLRRTCHNTSTAGPPHKKSPGEGNTALQRKARPTPPNQTSGR